MGFEMPSLQPPSKRTAPHSDLFPSPAQGSHLRFDWIRAASADAAAGRVAINPCGEVYTHTPALFSSSHP